jgi:hypothetical protein
MVTKTRKIMVFRMGRSDGFKYRKASRREIGLDTLLS